MGYEMTLKDIVDKLGMKVEIAEEGLQQDVTGGYVSDLLSDVMAQSKAGDIWITLQTHPNIVAVSTLKELAGIIIVQGRKPDEDTVVKAKNEKFPILVSDLQAFEIVGRLYQMGISGMR